MKQSFLKWLYPGMKVKRWIGMVFLGIMIIIAAASLFLPNHFRVVRILGWVVIGSGIVIIGIGIGNIMLSLINLFLPVRGRDLVNILYQKRFLVKILTKCPPETATVRGLYWQGREMKMWLHFVRI